MCEKLRRREEAAKSTVLILDSQIGTAAAAMMAVRILIDHGVPEENIIMVVILLSRAGGIHHLCKAFPKIKVLTAAVDDQLKELWIPYSEHDGAWRAREDEQLSAEEDEDDDEEEGGARAEVARSDTQAGKLIQEERQLTRQRSSSLRRPKSADSRGKKGRCNFPSMTCAENMTDCAPLRVRLVYAILPGMGSFGSRFFGC